ncbi:FHA domain-containing protein [Anaerolineales bacterium HSG25]|nr:FHA domain-containing protein [Anaerolineales bacterium HSG25]
MIKSIKNRLYIILYFFCFSITLSPILAQGSNPTITVDEIDLSAYPEVSAVVSVVNTGRAPLQNLSADEFEILEDNLPLVPPTVDAEIDQDDPIAVALVLDLSGSAPLEDVQNAAKQFIDSLNPQDRVALIGFNSQLPLDSFDPFKEVNFTENKTLVIQTIDSFETLGESAVYEAILKGVLTTADEQTERKAVLVLSDGHDTVSRAEIATAESPENSARDAKIPVFTVGIFNPEFESNLDYLSALASKTGGRYQQATNSADMGALFESVGQQLRQQYRLHFRGNKLPDSKEHTLTFQVNTPDGLALINEIVTYPDPPTIPKIVSLQQEINGELQALRSILRGEVLLVPAVSALNNIARVEYWVNDSLVETVDALNNDTESYEKWEWSWNTNLAPEGVSQLKIVAYDDAGTASEPFSVEIQVERVAGLPPEEPSAEPTEVPTNTPVPPTNTPEPTATATGPLPAPVADSMPAMFNDIRVLAIIGVGLTIILLVIVAALIFSRRHRSSAPPKPFEPPSEPPKQWGPMTDIAPQDWSAEVSTAPNHGDSLKDAQLGKITPPDFSEATYPGEAIFETILETSGSGVPQISLHDKTEILHITRELPVNAILIVQENVGQLVSGKTFPLAERNNTIGRAEDNYILLSDSSVSRHHAKIVLEGVVFRIYDLGSGNGVKINGKKVDTHLLRENDRLQLGRVKLIFVILNENEDHPES